MKKKQSDLNDGTYKPFNKPNNSPTYLHVESNHPPSVIKQIPLSISKRISNNSSSKQIFDNAAHYYNNVLEKSGYKEKLTYCPDTDTNPNENKRKRRKRSRNIIWFNPPYSKDVETNVGKTLLNLISTHFKGNHPYHKIFNRNNIKVSYGCLDNMDKIVKNHNRKITREHDPEEKNCNCPQNVRGKCPLDGQCFSKNVVYNAEVSTNDDNQRRDYIGISKPHWKKRLSVHKKSFEDREYCQTSLSEYIWELKDKNISYKIKWTLLRKTAGYNSVSKSCSLCLTEKLLIAEYKDRSRLLNKNNELVSKCRHEGDCVLDKYS